jgi:hypothetical protein
MDFMAGETPGTRVKVAVWIWAISICALLLVSASHLAKFGAASFVVQAFALAAAAFIIAIWAQFKPWPAAIAAIGLQLGIMIWAHLNGASATPLAVAVHGILLAITSVAGWWAWRARPTGFQI